MELSKSVDTSSVTYTASYFYHCHSSSAQRLQTKIGTCCGRYSANKEGRGVQASTVLRNGGVLPSEQCLWAKQLF